MDAGSWRGARKNVGRIAFDCHFLSLISRTRSTVGKGWEGAVVNRIQVKKAINHGLVLTSAREILPRGLLSFWGSMRRLLRRQHPTALLRSVL